MKTTLALTGMALALCGMAAAQEGERVVVPANASSRPRKLDLHTMSGSITVKTHAGRDVIVEASGGGRSDGRPAITPDGLRRIDIGPRGMTVDEQDNQIRVRFPLSHSRSVTVTVPPDTSLDLQTMSGEIDVQGVKGEISVQSHSGKITLTGVSGNVLANTHNGEIKATMDAVDAGKPLSFSTFNGTIDVTLPADYKGNVKLSSYHGAIYTDFDFKMGPGAITPTKGLGRGITGTINGGGADASFKTYNGAIYIRKKK